MNAIQSSEHRFVIVASKKRVHKKATLRNRAKRRVRAVFDQLELGNKLDVNIALNQSILTVDFGTLLTEIKHKYNLCQKNLYEASGQI